MSTVKQERHDDAEINELAAKIVEAHKSKQQQQPAATAATNNINRAGLNTILGFIKSNGKNKTSTPTEATTPSGDKPVLDERSQKGQFGWTTLGKVHIPYIFRGTDDKYCAVRMVESKLLDKYLTYLHQDIYNCTCIRSYYITDAEARLLNDVNFVHCDSFFGRDRFTGEDLIVRLSDAVEFYNFLDACYSKLLNGSSNPLDRCGFIRINKESVVPYTIYKGVKFVPLFYFEGETDNLKLRANKLEGWDLSYLKFCCKVQGIRNELFAHDSCSVISVEDIRNYFPPGTVFEDYWPQKMLETQYLITNKNSSQTQVGQWTRQPVGPPIATAPLSHPKATPVVKTVAPAPTPAVAAAQHMSQMYNNYPTTIGAHPTYQPTAAARTVASAANRATYGSVTGSARAGRSYVCHTQAPPPLVRSTVGPAAAYTNAQTTAATNYLLMNENYGRQQQASIRKYPPPPLIPVRQMNGGLQALYQPTPAADLADLSANNHQIINQQPAHQQPRSTATPQDDRTNGRIIGVQRKVVSMSNTHETNIPYKLSKAMVDGKILPAINMKPYMYNDLLVTLQDLVNYFFNNVPVQNCQQVINVLGIEVYKSNTAQMHVLVENGKCQSINETVLLVQVRHVIDYMPQLKYMLVGNMTAMPKRS
ncbi:uncharacterized protein [Atheta coriaria]|uniref:uncharacterized protein isoform X2 n=1 Tax=Dalotia coriaria TaxID=877792 RepID=UPI0031F3B445